MVFCGVFMVLVYLRNDYNFLFDCYLTGELLCIVSS